MAKASGLLSCLVVVSLASAPVEAQSSDQGVPDTIIFSGSADYPPFQWLDDNDVPDGFVIDLAQAIATEGGRQAEHRLMDWEDALRAVDSGEADVVALFTSEERRDAFDFSQPFYYVAHGIFSHVDGQAFGRLEALSGQRVAVVAGSYAEQRLRERGDSIRLVTAPDELACLVLVDEGNAVACVEAAHTARRNAADAGLDVLQTSAPFWPRPYVFGVRRGETELLEWLNEQLAIVQVSGTYHELYNAWLPQLEWHEQALVDRIRTLAWLIVPLLLLAILGSAWSWTLRKQVARKTRHLADELDRGRRLQSELHYRAGHDVITDLPNRRAFIESLQRRITDEPGWMPSLVAIRIENIEKLVTAFGYRVTDELVRVFGQRLKELGFQLVGYFAWGVYMVIPKTPMAADEMVSLVTEPIDLSSIDIDPQIIVGTVNETRTEGDSGMALELVRRVSTALLTAQERGVQCATYDASLEPDADDLLLLRDFRRYGTDNMFLQYQPKVNLATGRIQSAEALIRWQHPSLGTVSPVRFIPLLEQSGLITRVTRWVVEESVRMIRRSGRDGPAFSVSVNITAQDLLEPGLRRFISDAAGQVEAGCLRVEITETGFIEDPVHAREVLSGLQDAGIPCSVDDFGTGYSSLYYLSDFPIDEVKLDRMFVGDMLANERHRIIVRSTIALAHELGLTVTAEGVEDVATLEALAEMGCDAVQGFVILRPVSEQDFFDLNGQEMYSVITGGGCR
ncbi:MAG: putative bifunctional diguanylate cyclase/phosphodiesterase [Pseudomonadota bacterium]